MADTSSHPQPTAVDIFCGPGGLTEGFRRAGFRVAASLDSDRYSCMTYRHNHRKTRLLEKNVYSVTGADILDAATSAGIEDNQIDVLIGGPPCKGLSMANSRSRRVGNPHNKLIWEFVRLVSEIRPKAYVIENVKSLYFFNSGRFKSEIISALDKFGYKSVCFVLNAADFGVPQFRRRTFIVGTHTDDSIREFNPPAPTHGSDLDRYVTVSEAINDLPPIAQGGGGRNTMDYAVPPKTEYQGMLRDGCSRVYNHVTTRSTPAVVERFRMLRQGGNWMDIANLLQQNGEYLKISKTHKNIYRRMELHKPAYTIVNPRKSMYVHPRQNRLLSVREVARLQSFSDRYVFKGTLHSMQQQIADTVPVFIGKAVARRLKQCLFPRHML